MHEKLWDRAADRASRALLTRAEVIQQLRIAAPAASSDAALCEIASVYAFGDRRYRWCEVEAWLASWTTRRANGRAGTSARADAVGLRARYVSTRETGAECPDQRSRPEQR